MEYDRVGIVIYYIEDAITIPAYLPYLMKYNTQYAIIIYILCGWKHHKFRWKSSLDIER